MQWSGIALAVAVIVVAMLRFIQGNPALYDKTASVLSDLVDSAFPYLILAGFFLGMAVLIGALKLFELLASSL